MTVKLHIIQILLIVLLLGAVLFVNNSGKVSQDCPQPIINNYIDVNVITPPITFDKNLFSALDKNYSPQIIVNVEQKPIESQAKSSNTYVTNNYITDVNTPLVYYNFHMSVIDRNGNTVFDDTNNFSDGTQALTAMQEMTLVEYTQYSYGVMILSIDGVSAGDHEYWALYEDGNYSNVGISDIVINKPTDLEWKIETW